MSKLKQAIWDAAGWGPINCEECQSSMERTSGHGLSYSCCSNKECREKLFKKLVGSGYTEIENE